MNDEDYEEASEESVELACEIMEMMEGVEAWTIIEALIVATTNAIAASAPNLKSAHIAADGIIDSIKVSIDSMDAEGLCRWSNKVN